MWDGYTSLVKRLGAFGTLAFFLFCASSPLLFPVFDIWRVLVSFEVARQSFFPSASFYDALPLSAMFTALVFLFVCLFKTAYARISSKVMISALFCCVLGYVLINLLGVGRLSSELIGTGCGLALGYSSAVMALFWVGNLHFSDFRGALFLAWVAACALFINIAVMGLLEDKVVRICLTSEALLSALGCARLFLNRQCEEELSTRAGSNWWDVFGRLDISMVEGADDFETPSARALFLIVVPAAILLLLVADLGLIHEFDWNMMPVVAGGIAVVAVMLPLLRMQSDQALINVTYRFFLPLVAFASFALAVFLGEPLGRSVMIAGAFSFCTAYTLAMSAMLFAMAGRMRSLGLPVASMMIIVGCLVCMLSNANSGFDVLEAYRYRILVVLLAAAVIALPFTPSSRLWRVVINGIEAVERDAQDKQEGYARRCEEVSRECGLTAREAEILLILGRGHTSGFIAKELTVAESTVRTHRKNIYRKLGVSSREALFNLLDEGQNAARL